MSTNEEMFWEKSQFVKSGCREWLLYKDRQGYGVTDKRFGSTRAHRVAYMLTHGDIPDGLLVLHSCDNPSCVNPSHLHLGTHAQNQSEKASRGRALCGERHHKAKLTREQVISIVSDHRPQAAIALDYGVTQAVIGRIKLGQTWGSVTHIDSHRPGRRGGVHSYQALFTERDVRTIRASNDSTAQLARQYGVAYPTIARIRARKTYQSVRDQNP